MQSIMDRCFGRDWKTTLSGCLAGAGSALVIAVPAGQWHVIGQVAAAVGVSMGLMAAKDSHRDK